MMLKLPPKNLKNITLSCCYMAQSNNKNKSEEKDVSKTMTLSFPQFFCKNSKQHCFVTFSFRNNFLNFILIKKFIQILFVAYYEGAVDSRRAS